MTLTQYRAVTQPRHDNATGGGTDSTTDQVIIDPNKYLVTPLNQKAQIVMAILVSILTVILILKEIKRFI